MFHPKTTLWLVLGQSGSSSCPLSRSLNHQPTHQPANHTALHSTSDPPPCPALQPRSPESTSSSARSTGASKVDQSSGLGRAEVCARGVWREEKYQKWKGREWEGPCLGPCFRKSPVWELIHSLGGIPESHTGELGFLGELAWDGHGRAEGPCVGGIQVYFLH